MRSISRVGLAVATTASFPSPAQDYYEGEISLDQQLVPHPLSTFILRVGSEALAGAGIHAGDELVVDRAVDPSPGRILIVVIDGEHRLGRFDIIEGQAMLVNDQEAIPLTAAAAPWGVATVALRHLPGGPPTIITPTS